MLGDVKYVGSPVNKPEPDSHNGYEGTRHDPIDNKLCNHNVLFIAQKSPIKYPENILKKILNLFLILHTIFRYIKHLAQWFVKFKI